MLPVPFGSEYGKELYPVLEKSKEGLWSVTGELYLCTFQPERAVNDLTQFSELSTRWFRIMAVVVTLVQICAIKYQAFYM